jgi:hypothetical protein
MNAKRIVAFSFVTWALSIILSASPANARIFIREVDLTPDQLDSDTINISEDWSYAEQIVVCGVAHIAYEQRVSIPGGPSQVALVEALYHPGKTDLFIGYSCADGYILFDVGSCDC